MTERQPLNSSGIFYDSADLEAFKKWFDAKILGGATTNPLILEKEGILNLPEHISRINATLGLSMGQLVGAAEALRLSRANGDNYISLFWARRDEARNQIVKTMVEKGMAAVDVVEKVPDATMTLAMTLKYLETHSLATRVIIGSVRSVDQIEKAFSIGADIVTISPKLLEEWMFTQRGVETVEQFDQAYRSVKDKITLI